MGILDTNVKKSNGLEPPMIVVYGAAGTGKSTFASEASNPIFLDFEDSTKYLSDANVLDVRRHEPEQRYDMTCTYLDAILNEQHDYKTLVIDTLDWMERSFIDGFVKKVGAKSLYDPFNKQTDFGKGKKAITSEMQIVLEKIDKINKLKKMSIIILAHTKTKGVDDPVDGSYEQAQLGLQIDDVENMYLEKSDCVLYIKRQTIASKNEPSGFIVKDPQFITCSNLGTKSKQRLGLPPIIHLPKGQMWDAFISSINTNKE